jgi:fluoroquinolone transport system permease protein
MIGGITAFYVVVIYFLKDLGNIEKITTLLIFNEPTMVGFIFIGLAIILEKDQEVLSALFITPMNQHFYLISRILTLSAISLFCALGMVLMAKGTSFNLIHFSIGVFSSCVLFSFLGIYIVSFTTEILHFILRSIPFMILMSLPFLNYFGFTDIWLLKLFPVQGSLSLIDNSYTNSPNLSELIFGYISIVVWLPLLYWFVYRTFRSKLVNA